MISFAGGLPAPSLFPVGRISEAMAQAVAESRRSSLQYSTTEGEPELRELLAARTAGAARPEDVLVVSGSQQALDLVGKVFIDPGAGVIVESPTYMGALRAFDVYEPTYAAVEGDEHGPDPDQVDAAFAGGAVLLYLNPTFSNPTGRTVSEPRRRMLVDIARRHDGVIYEDDPYGALRFSGRPVPTLFEMAPERVIYGGSLSKILVPGFRLGWVAAAPDILRPLTMVKQASDLHTATTTQAIAAAVLADGFLDAHLPGVRDHYHRQRNLMLAALAEQDLPGATWTRPEGGMFLWLTLPSHLDATALLPTAVERGVAYVPGATFHAAGGGENTARLSYSVATPEQVHEGIARLAGVFAGR